MEAGAEGELRIRLIKIQKKFDLINKNLLNLFHKILSALLISEENRTAGARCLTVVLPPFDLQTFSTMRHRGSISFLRFHTGHFNVVMSLSTKGRPRLGGAFPFR